MTTTATLQDLETARLIHVISEGECEGLVNPTSPGQSIFFDGTALTNASGTQNYANVTVVQRTGTQGQAYLPGFNAVENVIAVNTEVKYASPITHTTTAANIDACAVTVQLPNGLQKVDDSGNSVAEAVSFSFYTKLTSSGTWVLALSETINGVAETGYEAQYRLTRPAGTGTWDIKMTRDTVDTTTPNTVADKTVFYSINEIQEVQLGYDNCALVALTYDAKTAGNVNATTFDFKGIKVAVPSNYNPTTRVYSGIWDGTLSATKTWTFDKTNNMWNESKTGTTYWTDNPVWCLYDLLTNHRYGLGEFVGNYEIDLPSFYNASVWCDTLVDDGTGSGTTEPRFRFNAQITTAEDSWKLLQNFAGTFNGALLVANGYITLIVDMPTTASALVSRATMSSDGPTYTDTAASTRKSVARVSWNNPDNAFQQEQAVYTEADPANNIPWIVDDATAWGCTSHGQALRVARWYVDTQLRNVRMITYKAPLSAINVLPGAVIKVADSRFASTQMEAMVTAVTGTTVVLDRPVTVQSGTCTIDVLLADGSTIEQRVITTAPGSTSTLTIASAFSQGVITGPGSTAIISGNISAQYFRVTDVAEDTDGWFSISAVQYDSTKYSRVETGISVPAPVFSDITGNQTVPDLPTGLATAITTSTDTDGKVTRNIQVTWNKPDTASTSLLSWRHAGQEWNSFTNLDAARFTIKNVTPDSYEIQVASVSQYGVQSAAVFTTATVSLSGASGTSALAPVTNLQVVGGGASFNAPDLNIQWTNPTSNAGMTPALKDFVVNVSTTGGTLLRSEVVAAVSAGANATYTYSYQKNQVDSGYSPNRSVVISVAARDGLNNTTTTTSRTFSNAAPALPTNVVVSSGVGTVFVKWDKPTDADYAGTNVWLYTTSGATLATSNLAAHTTDTLVSLNQVSAGVVHYVKVAHYDTFGNSDTGSGLNISAEYSATPSGTGIPGVSTLPGTSSEGTIVYDTTDGQLYVWHSGAWSTVVTKVPASGLVGTINSGQIASVAASAITGSIADTQLAAISASKVTGTLVDSQIAALSMSKLTGTITTTQIGTNTIQTGNIAANAITSAVIAANTILGSNIAAGTISTGNLAASSVTTSILAANAVTALNLAAGAVTTGKLVVSSTPSVSVWSDANFQDTSAWTLCNWGVFPTQGTVTDGASGGTTLRSPTGGAASAYGTVKVPVVVGNTYRLSCRARSVGSNGTMYLRWNTGTAATGAYNQVTGSVEGVTPGSSWTRYTTDWVATTPYASPMVLVNYTGTAGYMEAQDIRIEELMPGNLIVSGTITGSQVAANTITGGNIAANTITASNIAASTITTNEIAANTITGGDIAASTITGSNIAANTIAANNLVANTITAGQIATGTITSTQIAGSTITGGNIAGSTITGGNIAASTITAGNIAAGTITATQLTTSSAVITTSAQIANLTVQTLNIGNNAVTVPASAFSSGSITVSSSIDAQTVTLTTSGATVQIFGGASVSVGFGSYLVSGAGPYYDDCTWSASIYRDGSLLYTVGGLLCTAPYNSGAILTLPPLFDTPPAGGHTYTMRIAGSGSHNTFSASNRGLSVMEVKK